MTTDEIVSLLNVSSGTFRNISSKGKVWREDFQQQDMSSYINIKQLDELKCNDVLLNVELIQVYDKGEKYEEFIKMLGVDKQ